MTTNKIQPDVTTQFIKAVAWSFLLGGILYPDVMFADAAGTVITVPTASSGSTSMPTLDQVLENIKNNVPAMMRLVTGFAYITGLYMVIQGVIELRHFGEMRTMMSQEHGLKKPMLHLFMGGFLIYLPSAIQTGLATLWESPYPTAYLPSAANATVWQMVINNSFSILQLIGVVAFIRGLLMLSHQGGHGGQPGNFAKGMSHIIGGILCINMYDTVRMIGATLGLTGILDSGG